MTYRYIKPAEMDSIAESVLTKYNIPATWHGKVTRIDVDGLIEFGFGLEIEWEDIDHLSKDGIVLAAIVPSRKKIYMNETKKDLFTQKMGTMNFSKAHELGHWILHVTKQQDYKQLSFAEGETFFCRGGQKRPPEEHQADMFAASLLMPRAIISGAIIQLKQNGSVRFSDLYNLKDMFEVSISALKYRINDLGLLYISNQDIYMSKAEAEGQMTMF